MEKEELIGLIAECLVDPAYPDDAWKEAENIVMRIERWHKMENLPNNWFGTEEADINDLPKLPKKDK